MRGDGASLRDERLRVVASPQNSHAITAHFADVISTHHHLGQGGGRFGAVAGLRVVRAARPALRGGATVLRRG